MPFLIPQAGMGFSVDGPVILNVQINIAIHYYMIIQYYLYFCTPGNDLLSVPLTHRLQVSFQRRDNAVHRAVILITLQIFILFTGVAVFGSPSPGTQHPPG